MRVRGRLLRLWRWPSESCRSPLMVAAGAALYPGSRSSHGMAVDPSLGAVAADKTVVRLLGVRSLGFGGLVGGQEAPCRMLGIRGLGEALEALCTLSWMKTRLGWVEGREEPGTFRLGSCCSVAVENVGSMRCLTAGYARLFRTTVSRRLSTCPSTS